jgi:hypothetical protein
VAARSTFERLRVGHPFGDHFACEALAELLEVAAERHRSEVWERYRLRYRPRPLRRVRIPRPGGRGETRPLAIPTLAERVVMAAARIVLEPSLEADFPPTSHRFRPRLSAHRAPETVRRTLTWGGRRWVLDADIEGCFDEIDHDALGARIERRVWDRRLLKLPRGRLRARVFEAGIVPALEAGTRGARRSRRRSQTSAPQRLDEARRGERRRPGVMVSQADDLVVPCATRGQAEPAREPVAAVVMTLGSRPCARADEHRAARRRRRAVRLPRLPPPDREVAQRRPPLAAQAAGGAGDGPDQRQDR